MTEIEFDVMELPAGIKLGELQKNYSREDLIRLNNDIIDSILEIVRNVPDSYVTFVPHDPDAYDPWADDSHETNIAWTLGHVIVHTTASAEERAAHGSLLARGASVKGRARYEVPWETVTTTAQIVHRLEESRRIRLAYLDAWPDEWHRDNMYDQRSYVEKYGEMNAVGMTLMGMKHELEHFEQIVEIVRQAREKLG